MMLRSLCIMHGQCVFARVEVQSDIGVRERRWSHTAG
jgi:hypothetical protein